MIPGRGSQTWLSKAFTPSHMNDHPISFAGRSMERMKAKPTGSRGTTDRDGAPPLEAMKQKWYLLICDLWQNGTDSVHNMRVVNTDAKSQSAKTPENCFQEAKRGKQSMHLQECAQQHRHFSPFVASVDGLLGVYATTTLKKLASRLVTKWWQPYSKTCGYIKSRIAITLVHVTHCCMQGSRILAHRSSMQRPQWEDGAGLNLFR